MNKDSFGSLSHGQLEFGRVHLRKCLQTFCLSLRICRLHRQRKGAEIQRALVGMYVFPYSQTCLTSYKHQKIYWMKTQLNLSAIGLAHFSPSSFLIQTFLEYHSWLVPFASMSRDTAPIHPFSPLVLSEITLLGIHIFERKMLLFPVFFIKFEQKQFGNKWQDKEYCVERHLSGKDLVKSIENKSFPSYLALWVFPW